MKPDNAQEIPGKKSRPFDIRDFVLRRSVLIVVAGFAIFLALSPIALILRKPYYNTVGTILISPEVQLLVPRDVRKVPGNFREFAMTHAQRIKSQVVLSRILNSLPKEHWPVSLPKELSPEVAAVLLSGCHGADVGQDAAYQDEADGSWAEPYVVEPLPFTTRGTTVDGVSLVDTYAPCAPRTSEAGPEVVYRVEVDEPGFGVLAQLDGFFDGGGLGVAHGARCLVA